MISKGDSACGREPQFFNKFRLPGKVALVMGGSHGIGKAIALAFAEAGADVIIAARNLSNLEEAAQEISQKTDRKILPVPADVCQITELDSLVKKSMKEFDHIDILVNNAGGSEGTFGSIFNIDEEKWDAVLATNLKGAFFLSQAVARIMRDKSGGSIINIASDSGARPDGGLGVYGVAKAGLIFLTRVLAQELGQYNIRVNAICPGLIKTRLTEYLFAKPQFLKEVAEFHVLRDNGAGLPEDIAGAVLFFASEASSFATGQTLVLDGGLTVTSRTSLATLQ